MGPVAVVLRVVSALALGVGSFLLVQAITAPDRVALADSGAVAWIDSPLHGTEMMPAAVQVTGHGTDPSGVASLTLLVDGATVQTIETSGAAIETGHFTWSATPGIHQLVVRSMNTSGEAISSAPILVTILGRMPETEPDPTPTTLPETTTTTPPEETTTTGATTTTTGATTTTTTLATTTTTVPTTTTTTVPTTTTTTCPLSAPTLVAPANGSIFEPGSLQWSYTGCPATAFVAELAENPGFTVGFHTVTVQQGNPLRWNVQPLDLPIGTTIYWRVRAVNGPLTGPWSATWTFSRG